MPGGATAQGSDICTAAIASATNGTGTYANYDLMYGSGGSGSQVVVGTDGPDVLVGGSGNDVLCGLGGDDRLRGGSGNDILVGGPGNDRLEGGSDNDTLYGTEGERLDGGSGTNQIFATPVANPVVTVTYTFAGTEGPDIFCYAAIQLTGFQPNTEYPGRYTLDFAFVGEDVVITGDIAFTTDSTGKASLVDLGGILAGITFEANVDGVSSGTSTVACSAP